MARSRLRQEPYNPNAVDADNDGIVQERTAWERPAGTNIVDEFNRIIETGRSSLSRSSGWRVIDRDGNTVSYTPTYGSGTGLEPEVQRPRSYFGSTLGERVGTIGSTTGGTLEQRYGSLGGGRPADKLPSRIIPPDTMVSNQRLVSGHDLLLAELEPEERERQRGLRGRISELAEAAGEKGLDRSTVESLAISGLYWSTFLAGGGQVSALLNDFATGVGDSQTQSDLSMLASTFAIGGTAALKVTLASVAEKIGSAQENIDQIIESIADNLRRAGIKAGELSQQMLEAIREIIDSLASTFTGPSPSPAFAKSLFGEALFKAWAKLKLEPYNPDAFDGDNDGIVQEGTAWERPAGTTIVDAFGLPMKFGKMSGNREPGMKIIDSDGNPVDYTPSYMKKPTVKPDGPPTHGLSSVADIVGGSPVVKPPKPQKIEKQKESLFSLPKKWKEAKKPKFKIPAQKYDTPLLGDVMVTDGYADTSKVLINKEDGRYIKERRALHKAIVKFYRGKSKPKKDGEPKTVYFLGGGPGSGKTSMFKSGTFGIDPETVRLDPDEIKTMIPEYRKWISEDNVESAGLVHGESKHITEMATASLIDDGVDMVYDTTGDGNYGGMKKRLEEMRRNGHKIVARYSTISTSKAHQINEERFKETGRKVPGHQVDHVHRQVSVNVMRAIADGLFDDLELFDNEDYPAEPQLILSLKDGKLEILDEEKVKKFIAKGGGDLQPGRKSAHPLHVSLEEARKKSSDSYYSADSTTKTQAWGFYKANGFREINGTLRDPEMIEDDYRYNEIVDMIDAIDDIFEEHSASTLNDTKVYRGTVDTIGIYDVPEEMIDELAAIIEKSGESILRDPKGIQIIVDALNSRIDPKKPVKYRDDAYMSTSSEQIDALSFAIGATLSGDFVEMISESDEITGFPMFMEINVPGGTRFMAGTDMERELVFDRGTSLQILSYEMRIGDDGKPYVAAIAQMRPAKGKPAKLQKVDESSRSDTFDQLPPAPTPAAPAFDPIEESPFG